MKYRETSHETVVRCRKNMQYQTIGKHCIIKIFQSGTFFYESFSSTIEQFLIFLATVNFMNSCVAMTYVCEHQ